MSAVSCSLCALLNLAYDPINYPAFWFAEVIPDIVHYVKSSNFDLATTAKFVLSCLHIHLDCNQLLALALDEKEAEYCVTTLTSALQSPDLKGDGFAVHEILQILTNLTHPAHTTIESLAKLMTPPKGKLIVIPDYFDAQLVFATEVLAKNCRNLVDQGIITVIEGLLQQKQFLPLTCQLLWNLLHQPSIKKKIGPGMHRLLKDLPECSLQEDQPALYCCLWLLGNVDEKGIYTSM